MFLTMTRIIGSVVLVSILIMTIPITTPFIINIYFDSYCHHFGCCHVIVSTVVRVDYDYANVVDATM